MKELEIGHIYWPAQIIRGVLTGLLTGLVISIYSKAIFIFTDLNQAFPFLVFLLPYGAILTQYLYSIFGERYRRSTVSAIDEINNHRREDRNWAESQIPDEITPTMGLVAFIGASVTHISGAAGGKEGAGVQLGLSCSSVIEKTERYFAKKINNAYDDRSDYYLMSGAAAAFGALFNAPIAGVLFGTQLASPKATRLDAYLTCICSSFTAVITGQITGSHVMHIDPFIPLEINLSNFVLVIVFAVLTGLLSRAFCFTLHALKHFFDRKIHDSMLRVFFPSLILLALSLSCLVFTGGIVYNGLGTDLINTGINNEAQIGDFIFKFIFIALTYASGFIGGEVVPLMVSGSLAGWLFASITGADCGAFAALGAIGLLSGGTNLPLVCFILGFELFHYSELTLLFIMCSISFIVSGRSGIYSHQKLPYR